MVGRRWHAMRDVFSVFFLPFAGLLVLASTQTRTPASMSFDCIKTYIPLHHLYSFTPTMPTQIAGVYAATTNPSSPPSIGLGAWISAPRAFCRISKFFITFWGTVWWHRVCRWWLWTLVDVFFFLFRWIKKNTSKKGGSRNNRLSCLFCGEWCGYVCKKCLLLCWKSRFYIKQYDTDWFVSRINHQVILWIAGFWFHLWNTTSLWQTYHGNANQDKTTHNVVASS